MEAKTIKISDLDKIVSSLDFSEIETEIDQIIHEPLLNLSYSSKTLYKLFYQGYSDNEILEVTKKQIPLSTIIGTRRKFFERARESALFLLLAKELMTKIPPKRINRKNISRYCYPLIDVSGIDEIDIKDKKVKEVKISGFTENKHNLHSDKEELFHLTSLVLVGHINASNKLSFFVADKSSAENMATRTSDGITPKFAWDITGKHTISSDVVSKLDDFSDTEKLKKELPVMLDLKQTLLNTCTRGIEEEIYFKPEKNAQPENKSAKKELQLHHICNDYYDSDNSDITATQAKRNREISGVFLVKYSGNDSSGNVRYRDMMQGTFITDSIVKKEFNAKSRTYDDLVLECKEQSYNFCDGLARCLKAMQANDGYYAKIIENIIRDE